MKWFARTPLAEARFAVIDCETSGLDAKRDRLLSVGAVRVAGGRIAASPSFYALVQQAAPSAGENILVHGINGDAQLAGRPQEEVLLDLGAFVAECVPVGFHAPFDAAILGRHGLPLAGWLDLAQLLPAIFPERRVAERLEAWLGEFGIELEARHHALADAFATAQLLLVSLAEAKRQRISTVEALVKTQGARRWLTPTN